MSALEARLKKLEAKRANRRHRYLAYIFVNDGETEFEACQRRGFDESQMDQIFFARFLIDEEADPTPAPSKVEVMGRIPTPPPPPDFDEKIIPVAPVKKEVIPSFWKRINPPKEVF